MLQRISSSILPLFMLGMVTMVMGMGMAEESVIEDIASVAHLSARKCIRDLTVDDIQKLREAFADAATNGTLLELANDPFAIHRQTEFASWHRHYLHRLEHLIGVAMPFWDYADEAVPECFSELSYLDMTGQRHPNPLFNGLNDINDHEDVTERDIRSPFPTQQLFELEAYAMAAKDFPEFVIRLEQLHDTVLGAIGGSMNMHTTAPRDPLFWAILSNTDRILYRWQLRHPIATPSSSLQLEDATGIFTASAMLDLTIGWDRAFKRPNGDGDGDGDGNGDRVGDAPKSFLHGVPTKTDANIGLTRSSAFGRIGDVKIRAEVSNRTHFTDQSLAGGNESHGHGHGAVGGIAMSFTTAHGEKWPAVDGNEALKGIKLGAGTDLGDGDGSGADHPGKGSFSGANQDPVPETRTKNDKDNAIRMRGTPSSTANADLDGDIGTITVKAPGAEIEEKANLLQNTGVFVGAHNVTHFSNVSLGDPSDPNNPGPIAQASVAITVGSAWGSKAAGKVGKNAEKAGKIPLNTRTLGGSSTAGRKSRSATSVFAKGIQQWGGSGRVAPEPSAELQVNQITAAPQSDNLKIDLASRAAVMAKLVSGIDYSLRSERSEKSPTAHTILKLCDVPSTKSPFLVEVVLLDKYIIGTIVLIGEGQYIHRHQYEPHDRALDITRAHVKLLHHKALEKVPQYVSFRVTNLATGKRVKTPDFTVRYETVFY